MPPSGDTVAPAAEPVAEARGSTKTPSNEPTPEPDSEEEAKEEERRRQNASAAALTLEIVGDLPHADVRPPENILFVCKLNSVTRSDDLELIFSRFGKIRSCEVIQDKKSLQYAFIEYDRREDAEQAYTKMQNVLIDDRRIWVDFSQSVSKLHNVWVNQRKGAQGPSRGQGGPSRGQGGPSRPRALPGYPGLDTQHVLVDMADIEPGPSVRASRHAREHSPPYRDDRERSRSYRDSRSSSHRDGRSSSHWDGRSSSYRDGHSSSYRDGRSSSYRDGRDERDSSRSHRDGRTSEYPARHERSDRSR